ncbi:hypothetical protein HWI79_1130 [Cryptosporidium felis]|nr:hypothetical protein HWI79_1130 [Cryptosporidium felis]
MGFDIYDEYSESGVMCPLNTTNNLCCLSVKLEHRRGNKRNIDLKNLEFTLILTRKNVRTGDEALIGKDSLFPLYFCTPFDKNYCNIYFNFTSICKMEKYLEQNELVIRLQTINEDDGNRVLFNEVINNLVNTPYLPYLRHITLINEIRVEFKVEWKTIIRKREFEYSNKCHFRGTKKGEFNYFKSVDFFLRNECHDFSRDCKPLDVNILYENVIFNDPFISEKKFDAELAAEDVQINKRIFTRNSRIQIRHLMGGWRVKIERLFLSVNGFLKLRNSFPKYHQSNYYKICIRHYFRDCKNIVTTEREHFSILNFYRSANEACLKKYVIPDECIYVSNIEVYSRIPEILTANKTNTYYYLCFCPVLNIGSNEIGDPNIWFYGVLPLGSISVNDFSVLKLYSLDNKSICMGYITVLFSEIIDSIPIYFNQNIQNFASPNLDNSILSKRTRTIDYLEEMSILYIYIYWHIYFRSENESKPPNIILFDLYSRIAIPTLDGNKKLRIKEIALFIEAFVPPDKRSLLFNTCSICLPDNSILFSSIDELKHVLLFPHLKVLNEIYELIFADDSRLISISDFIDKCVQLGIKKCISVTWCEMITSTFVNITKDTCRRCIECYCFENIFL